MGRRALKWLGPGSLIIRHADGNTDAAFVIGAGSQSIVPPFDEGRGDSGIIHLERNIKDLGEERIAFFKGAGQMVEFTERDATDVERRSGLDRRQGERRA